MNFSSLRADGFKTKIMDKLLALPLTLWLSNIAQLATIAITALTVYLWQEAKSQRIASQLPLLVPCRLETLPKIAGWLFCGNFTYPRDDEFKHTGLLYLGIKNIGQGVARDAAVASFSTDGKQNPNSGYQSAQVPPGETIPLVIRYGYIEDTDLDMPHNILIGYQDIFGGNHYLQVQLWFENVKGKQSAEAVVICFSESPSPLKGPPVPIFRAMEWGGYYELQKLAKDHKL